MKKRLLAILLCLLVLATTSCEQKRDQVKKMKKQLLIYCGITMIKPMMEIKAVIEKEYNCEILITKGGSGNLLKSLKMNKIGDLYLPGSDSYIKKCKEEKLVSETAFVGYNKAAIMVAKGNPKKISSDLNNLKSKKYTVVIGNPESGSIGKETKKILTKKKIFDEVISNSAILTTDSKKLFQVLKNNEADLVINWYAVSTWKEQRDFVTAIEIDEKYASKNKLVIGLLKYSKHPEIAKEFMKYAKSSAGKAIFNKYGLGDM